MTNSTNIVVQVPSVDPSRPPCEQELAALGGHGSAAIWGDARVIRRGERADRLLPGEVLVVDELTTDLLGFLPACSGVVIESSGPWESAIPGVLHDDFTRSGAAALLRSLDITHVWGLSGSVAAVSTGDLVQVDPVAPGVWVLMVG